MLPIPIEPHWPMSTKQQKQSNPANRSFGIDGKLLVVRTGSLASTLCEDGSKGSQGRILQAETEVDAGDQRAKTGDDYFLLYIPTKLRVDFWFVYRAKNEVIDVLYL